MTKQYNEANKAVTDAENIQRKYNNQLTDANNTTTVAKAKVEGLEQQMSTLNSAFEKTKAEKTQTAFNNLRNAAEKLGVKVADIPTEYTAENFAELEKRC